MKHSSKQQIKPRETAYIVATSQTVKMFKDAESAGVFASGLDSVPKILSCNSWTEAISKTIQIQKMMADNKSEHNVEINKSEQNNNPYSQINNSNEEFNAKKKPKLTVKRIQPTT